MGFSEILTFIGAALLASVKFAFAPPTMILAGNTVMSTIMVTLMGALIGAFAFFYGGKVILKTWNNLFFKNKVIKKFTKGNRRLIKIKQKFGLVGLCLSVVVLSIPVVAFLLAKFYHQEKRALPIFVLSIVAWTFVLTFGTYFLKDSLAAFFE